MRKLFFILFLLALPAWAGTCGNNYLYAVKLRMLPATGSDQLNFLYGGYVRMDALRSPGGQVQNTTTNYAGQTVPADMVLCDAPANGNAIPYEAVNWDSSAGKIELYHVVPTLHLAGGDNVWLFLNNSSVTTNQQDPGLGTASNFMATAGYVEVCHHATSASYGDVCPVQQASITDTALTATVGEVGGAALFNGTSSIMDLGNSSNFNLTGGFSVEVWAFTNTVNTSMSLIMKKQCGATVPGWVLYLASTNKLNFGVATNIPVSTSTAVSGAVSYSNYHYLVGTTTATPSSSSDIKTYLDGVLSTDPSSTYAATSIGTNALNVHVGHCSAGTALFWNGNIDEERIYNGTFSADHVATANDIGNSPMPYYVELPYFTGTFVQHESCLFRTVGATATCPLRYPFTAETGHGILVGVEVSKGANPLSVDCAAVNLNSQFTDTLGTTFTQLFSAANTVGFAAPAVCVFFGLPSSSGNDTITWTPSSDPGSAVIWVSEFAGMLAPAKDVANASTVQAGASIGTNSVTPTTTTSLQVCAGGAITAGIFAKSATPSSGQLLNPTPIGRAAGSSVNSLGMWDYLFTSSTSSTSCTFTLTAGSAENVGAIGIIKYTVAATPKIRHQAIHH